MYKNIFVKNFLQKINLLLYKTKFFLKKWIYTINHKRIAINYLYFSFFTVMSGTSLATMIRMELSQPGSHFFEGDSTRYIQVISVHGLIMVFYVVVPIIFGFFANFFIPYHVGSKDVAFPRLNSMGFWLQPLGFLLLTRPAFYRPDFFKSFDVKTLHDSYFEENENIEFDNTNSLNYYEIYSDLKKSSFGNFELNSTDFLHNRNIFSDKNFSWFSVSNFDPNKYDKTLAFVKCSPANQTMSGWTFITPFSAKDKYTAIGSQDIAIVSILILGLSSTIGFVNLLITRRTISTPGLRNRKTLLPFLTISLFLVMRMLSLITPVLGAAMIMLLFDRHWNTAFFDYSYGGDVMLFNHLFWFFGHPEVYVVIIPAFGIINMIIPFYNQKRITGKNHLIWATYIMAYMGFLVWGHHMYLTGLDHRARSLYSTITVMISLPAIVKLVNWTLTYLNSNIRYDIPMCFTFIFFLFFMSGGITGLWLSHVALNIYVHDTFYVVAHFHMLFSAATFSAIFSAFYHYFNTIFNCEYNKTLAFLHMFFWTIGQWFTFLPLFIVGYNGLPRRYHDYPLYFESWHSISSFGHNFTLTSIFLFFFLILESKITKKKKKVFLFNRFFKRINFYLFKINKN